MLNTRVRMAENHKFEKDFFKLLNNSIFGKITENIRNHRDMKLVGKKKIDTSRDSKNHNRPLTIRRKKVIGIMKYELGGEIMAEFVALRAKMYLCKKIYKKLEDKC